MLALIVSWVGRHQVVGRRFPETKTGFWQVGHLKEWTLLRLEGHRSLEIVVHQCGEPAIDGELQQQGPKVEVAGVKPAQRVWSDSDHQIAAGVAYGVNHGADVVVAGGSERRTSAAEQVASAVPNLAAGRPSETGN